MSYPSRILVIILISVLILASVAESKGVSFEIERKSGPVVKVKAKNVESSLIQQEDFDKLLAEGKRLYLEEMDNEAALKTFLEAEALAQTREQKAEVYFYLSLIHYAASRAAGSVEFDRTVRRLIELDYYRELDKLISPPKYLELFAEIKKEYGVLRIQSSPPGAEVYVDNQRDVFGLTPVEIGHRAGSVSLRLKKGKAEKSDTLSIAAGTETSSPVYKLKKRSPLMFIVGGVALTGGASALLFLKKKEPVEQKGNIQVNSTPSGAEIFLDGASTGRITNSTLTDVPVGSHTVEVAREGYKNESSTVVVQDGQTATVSVTLTKHTLRVTEPMADSIWVTDDQVEIKWETGEESTAQNMDFQLALNNALNSGIKNYHTRMDKRVPFLEISGTRNTELRKEKTFDVNAIDFTGKINSLAVLPQQKISQHRELDSGTNRSRVQDSSPSPLSIKGNIRIQALTNVKIQLYKGGNLVETIVDSVSNSGLYTWTVSTSLQEGTDYSVRVSCVDEPTVSDDSDLFLVTPGYHFITKWGSQGIADGMFVGSILGIAISGYVYVADTDGQRIQKFTTDGTFVGNWGSRGSTDGQFEGPFGIEEDSSGNIFVVDAGNHRIQKFTSNGTHLLSWGEQGNDDGFFHWPYDIAIDITGNRYVVGQWNNRVQKFSSNGTFITKWGGRGSGDGQFFTPTFVAVGQNGYVYVADTQNHRIQKFDSNGHFVMKWGILGTADGEFNSPSGIDIDNSGYLYVCDAGNNRIQKFDSNGRFITKWGNGGWEDGEFGELAGIAVDESGNVYVCDSGNHRIQKFGPNTAVTLNKKTRK